jgi:hypothetical protein
MRNTMNFDLKDIEESTRKTVDVIVGHLEAKEGLGDPVGFKVLGPGSDEYEAAERTIQLLNIKEAAARHKAVDMTSDEGAAIAVDGGEARRQVMIDKCVVGWFGFLDEGKPAEFTPENLARLFKARPAWRRRVLAAIEDEAAFTGG